MTRLDDVVASASVESEEADATPSDIVDLRDSADEGPVIKLVNQIIAQAVEQGASDIHLAPDGTQLRVRFRVDGVLAEAATVPKRMVNGVISRVKIMSDLDIAEKRMPQDGRVGLTIDDRHVDLRVVTLPSVHGEGAVMRILDKSSVVMELEKLGMLEVESTRFRRAFQQAYGAVLVTGPTGSGKSTSLYAALGELNTPEKNIITIEDPVEYELLGVTQVQVNNRAGLSFATGLRSMMRADPDVIMVGEIRDPETAQIAIQAALTGHLVLSTVHANNVFDVIGRFTHMEVDPYSFVSALTGVLAQRLVRLNCRHCSEAVTIAAPALCASNIEQHATEGRTLTAGRGCGLCRGTGYKGRRAVGELLTLDDTLRELIVARAPVRQIKDAARRNGTRMLRDVAVDLFLQGHTTLDEVNRVTLVA
mgnify:CR=1 FL=1